MALQLRPLDSPRPAHRAHPVHRKPCSTIVRWTTNASEQRASRALVRSSISAPIRAIASSTAARAASARSAARMTTVVDAISATAAPASAPAMPARNAKASCASIWTTVFAAAAPGFRAASAAMSVIASRSRQPSARVSIASPICARLFRTAQKASSAAAMEKKAPIAPSAAVMTTATVARTAT